MARAWLALDAAQRRRVAAALVGLTRVSWQLRRTPSDRVVGLLGRPLPAIGAPREEVGVDATGEAAALGRAVRDVAGRLPWHPVCLPQAMALRWMCERRDIPATLVIGVRRAERFEAHAWVEVGATVPVGGNPESFTRLVAFSTTAPGSIAEPGAIAGARWAVDYLALPVTRSRNRRLRPPAGGRLARLAGGGEDRVPRPRAAASRWNSQVHAQAPSASAQPGK